MKWKWRTILLLIAAKFMKKTLFLDCSVRLFLWTELFKRTIHWEIRAGAYIRFIFRCSHRMCSIKKCVLKKFCNIHKKRDSQMFLVDIVKFLRTSILKNIWERLFLHLRVYYFLTWMGKGGQKHFQMYMYKSTTGTLIYIWNICVQWNIIRSVFGTRSNI